MQKDRILVISTDYPPLIGGITNMITNLIDVLKNDLEIDLLGIPCDERKFSKYLSGIEISNIPFYENKIKQIIKMKSSLKNIDFGKYKFIILANITPNFFLIYNKLKRFKDRVFLIHYNNKRFFGKGLKKHYFTLAAKDFQNLVISDWLYSEFKKRKIGNVRVLYPVFDTQELLRTEPQNIDISNEKNEMVLLTVSRLSPHKGHIDVLYAIKDLEFPIKYIICGDGPGRDDIEKKVKELNLQNVFFTGSVDKQKLVYLYSNCDIFIMVSKDTGENIEGFGYTFIEANLFSKPVIGSNIGGIPSAVEDGKTGFLVESGNIEMIKERIITLAKDEDLRKKMGEYGKKRAQEKFDVNYNKQKIMDCFLGF